jgi:ketosteroid isomerase-like protein
MATEIGKEQRLEIELAIRALNADFCFFLDHDETRQLADLFTDDALYTHGNRESHGRKEILELFTTRSTAGTRTSRHLQSGLRLQIDSETSAAGQSVCMTFGADLSPPISSTEPHLIADFVDEYRHCTDGRWRFSRRHIERIFVAPDNQGPIGSK